jgi:hypothetical protein
MNIESNRVDWFIYRSIYLDLSSNDCSSRRIRWNRASSETCKDVCIDKILIQTNQCTGESEIYRSIAHLWFAIEYHVCIIESYIFFVNYDVLFDRMYRYLMQLLVIDCYCSSWVVVLHYFVFFIFLFQATGAATLMTKRVLFDHIVSEDNIALLSLFVSKQSQTYHSGRFDERTNRGLCICQSKNSDNSMWYTARWRHRLHLSKLGQLSTIDILILIKRMVRRMRPMSIAFLSFKVAYRT